MKWLTLFLLYAQALLLVRGDDDAGESVAYRNFHTLSNIPSTVNTDGTLDGRLDIRTLQILPNNTPYFVNSWYYLFWLTLVDGSQCMAIANIATVDGATSSTRAGLINLSTKNFTGQGYRGSFQTNVNQLNVRGPNLTVSSPAPDNYAVMAIQSTVGGATFNLTVRPQGPNFYHGGTGVWNEGTGLTSEYSNPDMAVAGFVEFNGKSVAVDGSRSVSWYDRQFDFGQAPLGWELFWLYLSNGVRIAAWHTRPLPSEIKRNIATVWYPSGRHQVVRLNNDTEPQGAYQSKYNNITYHTSWTVRIDDPPAVFHVKCLSQNNEMVDLNSLQTVVDALWEGYAEGTGSFDGEDVTFFGNVEQYYGAASLF